MDRLDLWDLRDLRVSRETMEQVVTQELQGNLDRRDHKVGDGLPNYKFAYKCTVNYVYVSCQHVSVWCFSNF